MANNIKLRKQNFTMLGGYFFTFDEDQDALLQKTDDGNTAFSYPFDTLLSSEVKSLEYDGINFWTLQDGVTDSVVIKRWVIDNYVCKLEETFTLVPNASHKYNVDTFTIAHYNTALSATVSGGDSTLYLQEYSNQPSVITGAILHIGPNFKGETEEVVVNGTLYGGVTLTTGIVNDYSVNDEVHFHTHLWLLNNYNGVDASTGALYKIDSHTGAYVTKYSGGQYKDITASTFSKIDSFIDYGSVDSLVYVKGSNALFVDISEDSATTQEASNLDDSFDGNLIPPDPSRWEIDKGSPQLVNNVLSMNTNNSSERILSTYYLRNNFEVNINCTLGTHPTYSGSEHFIHSFGLLFPNESNRYCYIARANNTELDTNEGEENFHTIYNKTNVSLADITTSGVSTISAYDFKISRAASDVSFYYKATSSGSWNFLSTIEMFDSDCRLMLTLDNTISSDVDSTFDTLTFDSGTAVYFSTATALPFYGSMVMDNISNNTVSIIYGLTIVSPNMYRLQGSSSNYNYSLSPLESFVTSISLAASPAIIAANNLSTSTITAVVKDQFLQPISGRRVTFSENGDGSITAGTQINTNSDGEAATVYTAGSEAKEVHLTVVAEQTN